MSAASCGVGSSPSRGTAQAAAIPAPAMADTVEFLEEDCADTCGLKIKFPIDQEGAEFVFFPAVSDYLLEPDTLDVNDDGEIDISDPPYLLRFLFAEGNPPPQPYPARGADTTDDTLTCGGG